MKIELTLEEALAKASPRLQELMKYSAELLRKSEKLALVYHPDGFYLAFSGGKDSQALMHMAQLAGVKYTAHFSPSTIDPPENLKFIRKHYPEVQFTKVTESIYSVFQRRKCLPSMKIRWCCKDFKEHHGAGRVTLVGVRNSESARRANRREVEVTNRKFSGNLDEFDGWRDEQFEKKKAKLERKIKRTRKADREPLLAQFDQFSHHEEQMVTCVGGRDKLVVSPIIHWTDADVWEFLNNVVEVPHCQLYDEGWSRIGCICCPMASVKNTIRDIERWPWVKEKWIKAIMKVRKDAINSLTPPLLNRKTHSIHRRHLEILVAR